MSVGKNSDKKKTAITAKKKKREGIDKLMNRLTNGGALWGSELLNMRLKIAKKSDFMNDQVMN